MRRGAGFWPARRSGRGRGASASVRSARGAVFLGGWHGPLLLRRVLTSVNEAVRGARRRSGRRPRSADSSCSGDRWTVWRGPRPPRRGLGARRHGETDMTAARRMHLVAVWHVLRSPHPRTGDAGDHLVADEDGVLAFKDVERFVLSVMYVKSGSGATRARHFDSTENLLLMADLRRLGRRAGRRRTAELLAQFDPRRRRNPRRRRRHDPAAGRSRPDRAPTGTGVLRPWQSPARSAATVGATCTGGSCLPRPAT